MSAATSTIIGIGVAAAGTASSVYQAKKQSEAAKQAAGVQERAASTAATRNDDAMRQAMQMIQQNQLATQQSYAPRIAMGNNALSQLSRGMGLPAQPMQAPSSSPYQMQPSMNALSSLSQPSRTISGPSGAPGAAPTTGGIPTSGMGQPNAGMPNTGQANQATVTLEAPGTGERWTGSLEEAQKYIARGARRVA
jgi:hypothetical protein